MKPVLQALVLADKVYTDGETKKKVIAGTFNRIRLSNTPLFQEQPQPDGTVRKQIAGGQHAGSPDLYVSITDVIDGTELSLQFINLSKNKVLFETKLKIGCKDRLSTVELVLPLPPLAVFIKEAATYAFEIVCDGDVLGSHRLIADVSDPPQKDSGANS